MTGIIEEISKSVSGVQDSSRKLDDQAPTPHPHQAPWEHSQPGVWKKCMA